MEACKKRSKGISSVCCPHVISFQTDSSKLLEFVVEMLQLLHPKLVNGLTPALVEFNGKTPTKITGNRTGHSKNIYIVIYGPQNAFHGSLLYKQVKSTVLSNYGS